MCRTRSRGTRSGRRRARRESRPCRVPCSRWNRSATCRRTSPCRHRRSRSRTRPSALAPRACRACRRRRGARPGTRRRRTGCRRSDRRRAGSKPMKSNDLGPEARCVRGSAERDVLEARSTRTAGVEQHRARPIARAPEPGSVPCRCCRRSGCRSRAAPAASRIPASDPGHSGSSHGPQSSVPLLTGSVVPVVSVVTSVVSVGAFEERTPPSIGSARLEWTSAWSIHTQPAPSWPQEPMVDVRAASPSR